MQMISSSLRPPKKEKVGHRKFAKLVSRGMCEVEAKSRAKTTKSGLYVKSGIALQNAEKM